MIFWRRICVSICATGEFHWLGRRHSGVCIALNKKSPAGGPEETPPAGGRNVTRSSRRPASGASADRLRGCRPACPNVIDERALLSVGRITVSSGSSTLWLDAQFLARILLNERVRM